MSKDQAPYRQIFKSTSLFGGAQVFIILISIIRSKFIALLIGPLGIGIVGLLNSTLTFITALTNFGLERSSVKNIAAANSSGNTTRIGLVVAVLRRLVWITGILGALITFFFSTFLSELTFGNNDYNWAFMLLSVTLLLNQISAGQGVVLRGMHQLKYLAKSSLLGATSGLIISVPIYYIWGLNGIVPAIIISSVLSLFLTFYYSRKVYIDSVKVSRRDLFSEGKDMMSMGIMLSLSSLLVLGESYLIRIYIRLIGSIEDVGFYAAGFAIVNTYFGVIFTALTTDYYPKLAGIVNDNKKAILLMNQQSEMTVLIISPLLVAFLVFINVIVVILYSQEFLPISEMILWAGLGIFFKAASWALGVIFISNGDVKTLFWSEFSATSVMFVLNLLGYKYLGLEGLGVSFFIAYIYAYIQTFLIVKFKYSFYYSREFYKIYIFHLVLGTIGFLIVKINEEPMNYYLGIVVILISFGYSIIELDKRIDLKGIIKKYKGS